MSIENGTADAFVALIRKIVREELANLQKNSGNDIETFRHCAVKSVQTDGDDNVVSADVKDLGTGEVLTAIPNKSGENLVVGNTVRIYETQGSYNKRYIGLKCT